MVSQTLNHSKAKCLYQVTCDRTLAGNDDEKPDSDCTGPDFSLFYEQNEAVLKIQSEYHKGQKFYHEPACRPYSAVAATRTHCRYGTEKLINQAKSLCS
jgi:hypothetical protein